MKNFFNEKGWLTKKIPKACVIACYHQGECFYDIQTWIKKLGFTVPRDLAIGYLRDFGAWPIVSNNYDKGLQDMNDGELAEKVLWIACGDIKENGEWLGLIH